MQKLTDAELALLTEAQKEAYEKQMHEYQQREAFVERLEYLENETGKDHQAAGIYTDCFS